MNKGVWIGKIIIMAIVVVAIVFGVVMGTMYLWNMLIPELFNGPVLNFWQTLGLLALSKIFLWTFGCRHRSHRHGGGHVKQHWKERWANMDEAERERFKQKMKDKWCRKVVPGEAETK
ncbi:MAG: hypothetical protein KF803_12875 [Cyclobacteriaceae bacterium]|nr:hypothetical protein [Cyclobacteriaceae bacterium]